MSERTSPSRKPVSRTPGSSLRPPAASCLTPAVRSGTQSGGQALDKITQTKMSARFGHDFSQVRIHTDSRAEDSAEAFGAHAYANGSDIVFGAGKYQPGSRETERLLAHELTHVAQQARFGAGDWDRASARGDASEREADALSRRVVSGQSVRVEAAPKAALARDEDDGGGFFSSLASGAENLVKSEVKGAETVAGAAYNGYEKSTNFKPLQGALNSGVDWVEKNASAGNQKMVDDSKGHWYEGLAKADAWVSDEATQATGGLVKGVGDLGMGLVNTFAHPLDAAAGMEGIVEHNMTVPGLGSTLKAGHGAYDLLSGKKDGEYGSSWGQLADHILNPMTQMKDDQKFDGDMATNIIAPDKNKDGTTDWSAWKNKPVEAAMRALTNVAPIALGIGEAAAGDGAAEVSNAARPTGMPEPVTAPESVPDPYLTDPPTQPRPQVPAPDLAPDTVREPLRPAREEPSVINPNDPRVEPPSAPGTPKPMPDEPSVPDTRREIPRPPDTIPSPPPSMPPESEIPSRPPTIEPLPDSTPAPYIRPYEDDWLKTPWRNPFPDFAGS